MAKKTKEQKRHKNLILYQEFVEKYDRLPIAKQNGGDPVESRLARWAKYNEIWEPLVAFITAFEDAKREQRKRRKQEEMINNTFVLIEIDKYAKEQGGLELKTPRDQGKMENLKTALQARIEYLKKKAGFYQPNPKESRLFYIGGYDELDKDRYYSKIFIIQKVDKEKIA